MPTTIHNRVRLSPAQAAGCILCFGLLLCSWMPAQAHKHRRHHRLGLSASKSTVAPPIVYPTSDQLYASIESAGSKYAYKGRKNTTYWRSGHISSVIVRHLPPGYLRIDYIEPDSERGRSVVTTATQEWTYDPARYLVTHRVLSDKPAANNSSLTQLLKSNYVLAVVRRSQQWDDRKVYEMDVLRRNGGTVARKLWIDAVTGLVLKEDIYSEDGKLAITMAYADINFRPNLTPAIFDLSPLARRAGVQQREDARISHPAPSGPNEFGLSAAVYPLKAAGYRFVDATSMHIGERPTVHLSYSDGLDLISLFEQKRVIANRPTVVPSGMVPIDIDGKPGHFMVERRAPLSTLIWDSGSLRFTLVGETSRTRLIAFAGAVDQYVSAHQPTPRPLSRR